MACSHRTWFVKAQHAVVAVLAVAAGAFALMVGPAFAQVAPTYVVPGVRVDVTSQNATQARTEAFAKAPALAFQRLAQRLVLDDAALATLPQATQLQLDQMLQAITVEEERRSGTRYVGRLSVSFRGDPVRAYFAAAGVRIVDSRGQNQLVAPVMPDAPAAAQAMWRTAWEQGGFGQEARPIAVAPATVLGPPDWQQASGAANAAASGSAVYAVASQSGATLTATLTEVGPGGFRRERGRVTAAVRGGDAGLEDGLRRLADAANALIQREHKALVNTGAAPRTQRVTVSALYSGLAEWTRIKRGLDAADDAMVREVRIEAINRNGALLSFTTLGEGGQLAAELQRHGVTAEETVGGTVLRSPGGR